MRELARGLTRSGGLPAGEATRPLARTDRSHARVLNDAARLLAVVVLEGVVVLVVVLATLGLGAESGVRRPELQSPPLVLANSSGQSLPPASGVEP
jgi:hypothetical protein